jgi:hypothetical protein
MVGGVLTSTGVGYVMFAVADELSLKLGMYE